MVKGHTYSEQLFESKAFRHFVNTFLNKESGITKGCEITQTTSTIEIGQGFFVILGGLLEEDTGTSMQIPSEAGYYRLVYEIDLSKVNTEAEFNQGNYKFVKGVGAYSNLTQEDLDKDGNVYQFEFCQFRVTEAGIQDFIDKRTFLDFDNIYEEIRKHIEEIDDRSAFVMKDDINIITAKGASTGDTVAVPGGTKIELENVTSTGKKLTLENGGIKIGSGITKIIVSATTTYTSGQPGQHGLTIYKNELSVDNRLARAILNNGSNIDSQATLSITSQIIDNVKEGDIIYIYASSSISKSVSNPLTILTIQAIY